MAEVEWTPCYVCGTRRQVGAPGDAQWLFVEVERLHAPGYWQAVFCSEEHAARWFEPPMPTADHVSNDVHPGPGPRGPRAYLGYAVVAVAVVGVLALAVIGIASLLTS